MPPVGRQIPKEVMKVFDKYTKNNRRTLPKAEAVKMLNLEFSLSEAEADQLFETFDKDHNGSMSLQEFKIFYMSAGNSAHAIVEKFKEIDADNSGKLDAEEARKALEELKTGTDRNLEEQEIDFFIKTSSGDDGVIDLGQFVNMLFRLKMYKVDAPEKGVKIHV